MSKRGDVEDNERDTARSLVEKEKGARSERNSLLWDQLEAENERRNLLLRKEKAEKEMQLWLELLDESKKRKLEDVLHGRALNGEPQKD
nr:hypothetical protein BaRGS_019685 [Batillaria attramentaria]